MQAQEKVNYKKKKFYIPAIAYSQYPFLDNVLTQTTIYQVDSELKAEEKWATPTNYLLRKKCLTIITK